MSLLAENREADGSVPNASSVAAAGLPRRRLGRVNATRSDGFQVVFDHAAYDAMLAHATSRTDVEVCGILAGDVVRDARGPYLHVRAALPGHAAEARGASVTITAETWQDVNAKLEAEHPDLKICGWFHTHPDFGVFLSEPDVFIHKSFFDLPWQCATVIDPVRDDVGTFVWRGAGRGEGPVREPHLIERGRGGHDWSVTHRAEALAGRGRVGRVLGGPSGIGPVRLAMIVLLAATLLAAAGGIGWALTQGWDAETWLNDALEQDAARDAAGDVASDDGPTGDSDE